MNDEPSCMNCVHWRGDGTCAAYPAGVPWPIMAGDVAHFDPLPGDNGLQYQRRPDPEGEEVSGDRSSNL